MVYLTCRWPVRCCCRRRSGSPCSGWRGSWHWSRSPGCRCYWGAQWLSTVITKKADTVADEANAELNARVIEFARTQEALRVSRRAEPERSLVGGDAWTASTAR